MSILCAGFVLSGCGGPVGRGPAVTPDGDAPRPWAPAAMARSGDPAVAPWPMYGADPAHTYRSKLPGPTSSRLAWTYTSAGSISSGAVVDADGTVFVSVERPGQAAALVALRPDGSTRWQRPLELGAPTGPALDKDGVYVGVAGPEEGQVYGLDRQGTLRWRVAVLHGLDPLYGVQVGNLTLAPPGRIFVQSSATNGKGSYVGRLSALSSTGGMLWNYQVPNGEGAGLVFIGPSGTIYIGSVWAIDPTGVLAWSDATTSANAVTSIGDDGSLYNHAGYARDALGHPKWHYDPPENYLGWSGTAVSGNGDILMMTPPSLVALSPDGVVNWRCETTWAGSMHSFGGSPVVVDVGGVAYFAMRDTGKPVGSMGPPPPPPVSRLFAVGPTGTLQWSYDLPGACLPSGLAIGLLNTLFVTCGGDLLAFGPEIAPPS